MFLTDFRTRKYTGGIISRVGIFLTVTPDTGYFSSSVYQRWQIFQWKHKKCRLLTANNEDITVGTSETHFGIFLSIEKALF